MPKWPVPVFCCFLVPGELKNKYSQNWKRKLFYEVLHRKTPEARRGAAGGPQGAHTLPRRGDPLAAPGAGVAHLGHLRLRPFSYLFPRGKNPKDNRESSRKVPPPPSHRSQVWGDRSV